MADNRVKDELLQDESSKVYENGIKNEENQHENTEIKKTIKSGKLKTEETTYDSEDDEDDNLPLVELQKKLIKKKEEVKEASASDSEDNIPISELLEKNKKTPDKKSTDSPPRKRKRSSTTTEKKKSSSVSTPSTPSQTSASKGSSFEQLAYTTTIKGGLIQKLLCRWWYAVTWPDPADIIEPPENYLSLDGFPGVYICVQGDQMGQIFDNRNKATCPCFRNFCQKSSKELLDLLVKAFNEQKKQLIEVEGEGTDLEAQIVDELNALKSINVTKADKEFEKFVHQSKNNVY